MHHFLHSLLAALARGILRRQRPFVVGVTGSVGKTSAREAIRAVLAASRRVRASPKNYNNEVGLPVSVIGGRSPGSDPFAWAALILRGIGLATVRLRSYPEALVLEYGADHPGDIASLTAIAHPSVAVVTAVGPAHTAFFGSVEKVSVEKRRLVTALGRDGIAVLNRDDERVATMRDAAPGRVVTYGFHIEADVRGVEFQATYEEPKVEELKNDERHELSAPSGIAFKVTAGGSAVPIHIPGCLGRGHASAALAATAVGTALGRNLVEISHAIERSYVPAPGRLRLLPGVKRTLLVDDSYNASPLALAVALEALRDLVVSGRKFAVLGDMLELGPLTEHEHRHAGELVAAMDPAYLVTVGEAMRHAAAGARAAGMSADRVLEFRTASEAGRYVQDLLAPGDAVLVKGSQGVRMERIVKELMAEPLRAQDLLCRQEPEWLTL